MSPIRSGLVASSSLQALVCEGLGAVERKHLKLIEGDVRSKFGDSLDIDKAFHKKHEEENRWDYLLGHADSRQIVGLEPHTANNSEISVVINKRAASLQHLRGHLKPGVFVSEWFWVASGKVDFTAMDKALLRLTASGIDFVGKALLAKKLPGASPKKRK